MASSGNFCTLNHLAKSPNTTLTQGNLYLPSVSYPSNILGTMGVSSGKWYFEARCQNNYGAYDSFGVIISNNYTYKDQVTSSITKSINWTQLGSVRIDGTEYVTSPSYYNSNTKIVGCALDLDNNKVYFHGNGSYIESHNPNTGSGGFAIPSDMQGEHFLPLMGTNAVGAPAIRRANFGQDSSFGGTETAQNNSDDNGHGDFYYAPPTGFLAMCSANLPVSDDIDPAQTDDDYPCKNFNTVLYTGNASNGHAITGVGFQPDMVWYQRRSVTGAYGNGIIDSSRGVTKGIYPNRQEAEANFTNDFASFDSDGFTLNAGSSGNINNSGQTFVAWCWKMNGGTTATNNDGNVTTTVQANSAAGQSIVQWTGTGTNSRTLGTGLSKKVEFIMLKDISTSTYYWICYHKNVNGGSLPGDYGVVYLNDSSAYSSGSGALTYWDISEFTDSVFSVGGSGGTNTSGNSMLAYCFHSVEGYSKFSSYTGNGNTDGAFIYTGFRPRMLFLKRTDSAGSWQCHDSERDVNNPVEQILLWNTTDAEFTSGGARVDFYSNGFKLRNTNAAINASGGNFIYGAWGDVPFKYNNTF